jgi:hypothetical protein
MAAAHKEVIKKIKTAKTKKDIKKWQEFCDKLGEDRDLFVVRDLHGNMDKHVMRLMGLEDEDAYHKRVKAMHAKVKKLYSTPKPESNNVKS